MRVTEHWHRLPKEAVSLLGDTQKPSGRELEQLVPGGATRTEELDKMTSRGLFQLQPFYDLKVSHVLQKYVGRYLPHFTNLLELDNELWNFSYIPQFVAYFPPVGHVTQCAGCF